MKRYRINYWSCSKLADWLRGDNKPMGLTLENWEQWRTEQSTQKPFRYWLAETGLIKLQNFFMFPIDIYRDIKRYIRNRWIDKTHYINTGFKPGHYYEFDHKILHGLFNELVDFVEIEFAYLSTYNKKKKYNFHHGRCVEAGLDYLDWACNLKYDEDYLMDKKDKLYGKFTPQALATQKIRELYLWWKDIRPNRPDPMDLINFVSDTNLEDKFSFGFSKQELSNYKKLEKIEKAYDKEDTKMLIELIKIRSHVWS
jgi:hypothetical protein